MQGIKNMTWHSLATQSSQNEVLQILHQNPFEVIRLVCWCQAQVIHQQFIVYIDFFYGQTVLKKVQWGIKYITLSL